MPKIGVEKLFMAVYNNNNGVVSYSNGVVAAKMVKINISIDAAGDNDFYADNAIAESDNGFAGGTVSVTPDTLTQEASKLILGLESVALTGTAAITGVTDANAEELLYDDRMAPPFLGVGTIIKCKRNGATAYRAVVLCKNKFDVPPDAAETQGKTINWQTDDLSGKIYRDDSEHHTWKREATFTTVEQAEAYLRNRLNMSAATEASSSETETQTETVTTP